VYTTCQNLLFGSAAKKLLFGQNNKNFSGLVLSFPPSHNLHMLLKVKSEQHSMLHLCIYTLCIEFHSGLTV